MPEDNALPEIESRARDVGWVPQDEFRGDKAKWVDAETFLKRADEILPVARADNKRLRETVHQQNEVIQKLTKQIANFESSVEDLRKFHSEETARRVEDTRKKLLSTLKEAREAGDIESETHIIDELTKGDRKTEKATGEPAPAIPAPPKESPIFTEWKAANPRYGTDKKFTRAVHVIATELREEGTQLQDRAFLDEVVRQATAFVDGAGARSTAGKSEGGERGGSAGNAGAGVRGKGYNQLPPEAREVCDRQTSRFVGQGKMFKSAAEWQAHYAKTYFESEGE